jgi:hypothetical protein
MPFFKLLRHIVETEGWKRLYRGLASALGGAGNVCDIARDREQAIASKQGREGGRREGEREGGREAGREGERERARERARARAREASGRARESMRASASPGRGHT